MSGTFLFDLFKIKIVSEPLMEIQYWVYTFCSDLLWMATTSLWLKLAVSDLGLSVGLQGEIVA